MSPAAARKYVLSCVDHSHRTATGRYFFDAEDVAVIRAAKRLVTQGVLVDCDGGPEWVGYVGFRLS